MKRHLSGAIALVVAALLPLPCAAEPDAAHTLARLFTSGAERHQIDLERKRVMAGDELSAETQVRDPDIHFKAMLYPPDSEPLLWINRTRATLAQWQSQLDRLVVQRLWLKDEVLFVVIEGERYRLKPNQVFNRYTGAITEAHEYVPVNPVTAVEAISGGAATSSQVLVEKARALQQINSQLQQ